MGQFKVEILAVSQTHGCDRTARPGGKLHDRCGKLSCPDCLVWDFVNLLRQKGFRVGEATFTHNAGAVTAEVVDDLLRNERRSGQF